MPNNSSRYVHVLLFFLPLAMPMHTSEVEADDRVLLADIQSNEAAWHALPHATLGESVPLPTWARMLATRLPLSTAALLELDFAQRTKSPVAADLRAAMRFMVAQANGCDYAAKAGMLDLRAAGASQVQRDSLADSTFNGWSTDQQNALLFARNMSIASSNVTDDEFAALVKAYGENQSASMVLLAAYANMQDRLLMCLGADAATDAAAGTLVPVAVSFSSDAFNLQRRHPPATESPELPKLSDADAILEDGAWSALTYDQLQKRLAEQRAKPTRLAIPGWSKVAANLPNGMFDRPSDIVWYRIVFGYAPELAIPFERFMRISGAETSNNYGRIFGTSLFWLVTRSAECPYCMGHCEMNWEVAGLSLDQIAERSQKLASNDWSGFPEEQQRAFAFARKLSLAPDSVSPNDLTTLVKDHGPELALSIALHTSRYHYMTRISNGFQLKLESENVFFDYWNKQKLASRTSSQGKPFIEVASDSETWNRLPKVASGETGTVSNLTKIDNPLTPEATAIESELRSKLAPDSEAIAMLNAIVTGSTLSSDDGWFTLAKASGRFGWEEVVTKFDTNADQTITPEEFNGTEDDFLRLDRSGDKQLTVTDFDWSEHSLTPSPGLMMFFMADHDANGKVTRDEFAQLFDMVAEKDASYLALDELRNQFLPPPPGARDKRADRPSRSTLIAGLKSQEIGSLQSGPNVGDTAPDFTLKGLDGESVTLSEQIGEKPIVLIFGNFTCGPFRSQSGNLEKLYQRYQDRAKFFLVYVREAHPSDGWWMLSNQKAGINLAQPKELGSRQSIAQQCQSHLNLDIPFLVDDIDDNVGSTYSGMPNRLYLIDQQGEVAFKNGRGPFGFHPRQLEQSLILLLSEEHDAAE